MNNEKNDVSNFSESTTKYYIITNNLDSNEFIREISKIPTTYFCTNPFEIRNILNENTILKQENAQLKQQLKDIEEYLESIKDMPDADMYIKLGEYKEFKHILDLIHKGSE